MTSAKKKKKEEEKNRSLPLGVASDVSSHCNDFPFSNDEEVPTSGFWSALPMYFCPEIGQGTQQKAAIIAHVEAPQPRGGFDVTL